jgi:CTP synthase (UTP-ammonia lyase)
MQILALIDLPPDAPYRRATVDAIRHAADADAADVDVQVRNTDDVAPKDVRGVRGVVIGPGSPYRDETNVWAMIRAAREHGVPLVGT